MEGNVAPILCVFTYSVASAIFKLDLNYQLSNDLFGALCVCMCVC